MPKPKNPDPDRNLYRRGEVWWCRYVLAGAERRVSLRTADVKAARRARDRLLREAADRREGRGPEPVRKWEDAVEAYLAVQEMLVRSGALSAETAARYDTSIVQLSHALEGAPLAEITPATVLDFVMARREDGLSSSTIRNDLTARIERHDVHPDGRHATLRRGVKRNTAGLKTRTIDFGRAAAMLDRPPKSGRLFPNLSTDSAVVSTRYGQWCRQRRKREDREAAEEGRAPVTLVRYRPARLAPRLRHRVADR